MATSGTVDQTSVEVATVLDHAFRRCGKLASTVSGELLKSARENLFLILTDLSNRGLTLFCVQKYVLGTAPGQTVFPLGTGTVDVLNLLYRTVTVLAGTVITGLGWQGVDLLTTQSVSTVGLKFTLDTTATLVYETSDDLLSWVPRFTRTDTVAAGVWVYQDLDAAPQARYWRVRSSSGVLPALAVLEFSNAPYELPMTALNRDDYINLPNKTAQGSAGSKSLQYWFDKQIAPQLWVQPATQGTADQIVVWTQRYIQDVGALSNTLAVPSRWLESVILTLACRCALELPAGELPPGRFELLETKAAEHLARAEDGERDGAPIRLQPNIRGYTR